jgi:ribonuclease Z
MTEDIDKAKETRHSTAEEAARIATLAKVNKLLIGHFSARYKQLDGLLTEAKKHFAKTFLACEGDTFVIEE